MTYEEIQKVKYRSFESENEKWREGQERCIREWVAPHVIPGDALLDCACGDGVGLRVFRKLGLSIMGIEFEREKAEMANRVSGAGVIVRDFHEPCPGWAELFDVVYSSHSLEHAHDPRRVLDNFYAMLKPGGQLFLILPCPDNGPDDAHCGKRVLGTEVVPILPTHPLWGLLDDVEFELEEYKLDTWREPEVWVRARKV